MKASLAVFVSLVAITGCSSSQPLAEAPGDGGGDAGPSADGVDCGPATEFAPCRTDSDCRSAYLVCVPPDGVTLQLCRDGDAAVSSACPSFPELSTAPLCPEVVNVTSTVCEVRYQRPCHVDTDCGPTGSTCEGGACTLHTDQPCATTSDCPSEWTCAALCPCPGSQASMVMVCQAPFAVYRCPECAPLPE